MTERRTRQPLEITSLDIQTINYALGVVRERLDALEGLRGPVRVANRIQASDPEEDADVVTQGSLRGVAPNDSHLWAIIGPDRGSGLGFSLGPTTIPQNLQATGTIETVVLTWDRVTGGPIEDYIVERAEDEDFLINPVQWRVHATKFVDDMGLGNAERWYRVRSVSMDGTQSGWSDPANATTVDLYARVAQLGLDHLHAITQIAADGIRDTFDLFDMAEYMERVTMSQWVGQVCVASAPYRDGIDYWLSDDRTQLIMAVTPVAGMVIEANYVVMRI